MVRLVVLISTSQIKRIHNEKSATARKAVALTSPKRVTPMRFMEQIPMIYGTSE